MSRASQNRIVVYYDGSCPSCVADRERYEKLAGSSGSDVDWVDITGRDEELTAQGIDPGAALRELHVRDSQGRIHRELDAYILLMARVPVLKPVAFIIGLPGIRQLLAWCYRTLVMRRLRRTGRVS